jgi:hemoglobin
MIMARTMFERLGGFGRVRRMVASFYDKVTASPALGRYFEHVDMATLIDHQTKFVAGVTGGPIAFNDEALRRAHARLGISRDEFAEIVQLLGETLEEHEVADEDIDQILHSVQSKELLIVSEARAPAGIGG